MQYIKKILPVFIDLVFLGFFLLVMPGLYANKNICDYAIPLDCYIEYTVIFYCLFALSLGISLLPKTQSWITVSLIKMLFFVGFVGMWFLRVYI